MAAAAAAVRLRVGAQAFRMLCALRPECGTHSFRPTFCQQPSSPAAANIKGPARSAQEKDLNFLAPLPTAEVGV